MSACIYHDAESVAICAGCDFGVCQQCMDDGADGVCSTCTEERDLRKQTSALQREYTAEEQVPRCNYCRVATDDETPLDEQGYCDACRSLARCCLHDDLIAVGHCKACRKEYCRKCLGFTDICQTCTAANKARPKSSAPPPAAARPGKAKKGAAAKAPEPVGAKKKRPGTQPMEASGKKTGKLPKGTAPLVDENGKKIKKPPSRGTLALEAKLNAKASGRSRFQIIGVSVLGALGCIIMLSGMFLSAHSPESQAKQLQQQMLTVHKAVVYYHRKTGHLPDGPPEIYRALQEMRVKGARSIRVALKPNDKPKKLPTGILYQAISGGFVVTAADSSGKYLSDTQGNPIYLDQYYDSSR